MPSVVPPLSPSAQAAINSLSPDDRRVLTERELSQRWGVSPKTLQRWRNEGRGPKYLKLNKRVSYPLETVFKYEQSVLHESTCERTAA